MFTFKDYLKEQHLAEAEVITSKALQKIGKMSDLDAIKKSAVDLIDKSRTAPRKKASLKHDVTKMSTKDKILALLWNALLAGEKLGSVTSTYAKRMQESWYSQSLEGQRDTKKAEILKRRWKKAKDAGDHKKAKELEDKIADIVGDGKLLTGFLKA